MDADRNWLHLSEMQLQLGYVDADGARRVCRCRRAALPALVQTLNHGAVHDKLAIAELRAVRACEDTVLDIGEDLELLPELTAISSRYGLRRPLIEVAVPERAVVRRDRGDSTEDVVRAIAVRQGCEQA